ncbi:MAG: hypothetical protein L0332_00205 [Chloroflexi bacterium]|nr:hypothetical protein [Chloroflexota bacterium]MCI0574656.1 hypothetical protein [Chloroflexota bacterium]MCI0649062.1 hypothetical protein [Chloroflexota bacterium]MCI0725145.1 hypothetical protein [Chloroflexota bacterium]
MGKELVEKMLPSLEKTPWPQGTSASALGKQTYDVGLEKLADYTGDPKVLAAALRTFQTGDSRPYALAGVAYTLVLASREEDGSYAQEGLDAAMQWLEQAQELAPDVVNINTIEAFVYIYSGRHEDARLVLDYLYEQDPACYFLATAEIAFWQSQGMIEETVEQYEKAVAAADTVPRKLRLRSRLGDFYLEAGQYDRALQVYKEAVHFAQDDARLWHHMSLAFFHQEDYKEAARCNKRSLELQDSLEARQLQVALKEKMGSGGLAGRLFGR